jgi:integrase
MIHKLKYLSRERSGLLLYSRQIPADIRQFYEGRILRRQSLRTHDPVAAASEAIRLAQIDDEIWQALRTGSPDVETAKSSLEATVAPRTMRRIQAIASGPKRHHLSDALAIYVEKHRGRGQIFAKTAERAFARAQEILGNPELADIKRADARRVLDALLAEGLKTASIQRYLATISSAISVALLEFELEGKANPFAAMTIPNFLEDVKVVPSFSEDELRQIAAAGLAQKIEPGLVAAMQIETGCRVREIALLRTEDLNLTASIPFVNIIEHREHGRRLKTGKSSERVLPLLGASLEAARIAAAAPASGWLFPKICKSNPASAVNRWLQRTLGGKPVSHSARHAMETRLVRARVDQRLVDVILGHKLRGQGATYFSGYKLEDIASALEKIYDQSSTL